MNAQDAVFCDRIESAIDARDAAEMQLVLVEWDGQDGLTLEQFKAAFPGATRRDWIDSLVEDCESLLNAIRSADEDEYWAIRTRS